MGRKFSKAEKSCVMVPRIYDNALVNVNGKTVDVSTTQGFIYLTPSFFKAAHYGNKHCWHPPQEFFYVFKVSIEDELLLCDGDELRLNHNVFDKVSFSKSLEICNCVSLNMDIDLLKCNGEYLKAPSNAPGFKRQRGKPSTGDIVCLHSVPVSSVEQKTLLNKTQKDYISIYNFKKY